MDGNTVTDFVHPLRASHASPSLREGEDTPPTTNLRQTPFNSPLHIKAEGKHIKGEGKNLPFAERRGRVQAKRRTQGMHETSSPSKPPLIPPWASRGREGHCSPAHIKGEPENLPFAERRGRVQAKRRTQGMHETSPPSKPPLIPPWASRGRKGHCSPLPSRRREVVDGNASKNFGHPLRASHASPSLREGEVVPPPPPKARCRLRRRPRFRRRFAWCRLGGGCRSG